MRRPTTPRRWRSATIGVLAVASSVLVIPLAHAETVDDYVALGDSYSSGNGTYAPNLNWDCYRSTYAYPYIVGQQRPNTDLTFAACQGATTEDIVNTQAQALTADTDYVSITIGGNDIGFSELIIGCAGYWSTSCKAEVEEAHNEISNVLPAELDGAYAAIKAGAPNVEEVVVLGYALFFAKNYEPCDASNGTTEQEAAWLNGVAEHLDAVIADRAAAAGFTYKSSIRRFRHHDVCASEPYLNGLSWSFWDMFHPTRSGHAQGLAPLLREAIG